MSKYTITKSPSTCFDCEQTIPADTLVYRDPFMDDEDGTMCMSCEAEYDAWMESRK